MNVATIQVPRAEAESKLREYRKRVHQRADSEYTRIREAYEAAAAGKPLLVLSAVMEGAPRDAKARPMLSIARADQRQVKVTVGDRRDRFDVAFDWRSQVKRDVLIDVVRPLPGNLAACRAAANNPHWDPEGFALVPIVPPDVKRGHDLGHRFVLWEVEQWADMPIRATPDRDPYLLERIADDLYAVVGEWDLTPLEQAIMRDRAR